MSDTKWYGLGPNGEERAVEHAELMKWAYDHEQQFQVGWSDAISINGTRLVRGKRKIAAARAKGWDDLANKLVTFGVRDEEQKPEVPR